MPDWFVINMDLTLDVFGLAAAGGFCLLISAALFLDWASRAGWVLRIGFGVQWLLSALVLGLLLLSRLP
jgi:hypothetical protein